MSEKMILNLHKQFCEMKFDELEECAISLEGYLKNELRAMEERHKKETSTMTEEQKENYYDFVSDDYFKLTETFPQTLRISLFVHAYSLFEHEFEEVAKAMGNLRGIKIAPKDLRDDGITRSKTYLKNVVLMGFPDSDPAWSEITTLNKIRNFFVHREGYLPKDANNEAVEHYVTASNGALKLDGSNGARRIVIVSEVFNQDVLKTFERFNDILFNTLLADAKN